MNMLEDSKQPTLQRYALVEPALCQQFPTDWDDQAFPRRPLMHQAAFAHLCAEGPWLIALGADADGTLETLRTERPSLTIQALISSPAGLDTLAQHLGDALVAQEPSGQTLLLRSYAPHVLPVLDGQAQAPWHAWLFSPIHEWIALDSTGCERRRFTGTGLAEPLPYVPITLDEPILVQLASDQHALALLTELQRSAPEVFSSACHGDRLAQVQAALDEARRSGLTHPDDHGLFAVLTLMEGRAPNQSPDWPDVLHLVLEQDYALGHALEEIRGEE
jgi:hypothetical protein